MRREYQGGGPIGNSSASRLITPDMSKEKSAKKVIDTHKVTPEAGKTPVDPAAKRRDTEPPSLDLDESSPRKKGKDGPMKVGVNFDHSGN